MSDASSGSTTADAAGSSSGLASHADSSTLPTTSQFVAMGLFVAPMARTTAAIAHSSIAALAPLAHGNELSSDGVNDSTDLHNVEAEALEVGHEPAHEPEPEHGHVGDPEHGEEHYNERERGLKKRQKKERRQARIAALQAGIHVL